MSEFKELILKKFESRQTEITSRFKDTAESSGWDPQMADSVRFSVSGVNIPNRYKESIQDLEYGTLGSPARSAIRKVKPEVEKQLMDAMSEAGIEYLTKKVPGVFTK